MLHDAVEQIAVHDPEPLAVRGRVDRIFDDGDAAQVQPDELARQLIVIARDVNDLRALARAAQDLLHDIVVRLRPVPALLQLPAVQDVADQIEGVGLMRAQEIEEIVGLAPGSAQMDV